MMKYIFWPLHVVCFFFGVSRSSLLLQNKQYVYIVADVSFIYGCLCETSIWKMTIELDKTNAFIWTRGTPTNHIVDLHTIHNLLGAISSKRAAKTVHDDGDPSFRVFLCVCDPCIVCDQIRDIKKHVLFFFFFSFHFVYFYSRPSRDDIH